MGKARHFVRLADLGAAEIMQLLDNANAYAGGAPVPSLAGKVIANIFCEPSTRTQYSFEMAQHRLGIRSLNFTQEYSSIQKGETLYDTVKTFAAIGVDGLVIRHSADGYFDTLMPGLMTPILNAGDGCGNHPTQALLDLLTIYQEFGRFEGLQIAIVGDIAHSRVAHSNIEVMQRLGMQVRLVAPESFQEDGYQWDKLDDVLADMDIILLLRVQRERHVQGQGLVLSKEAYHAGYGLTEERECKMKDTAIIMHPGPVNRGVEIAGSLVECERSRIAKQVTNGVFVRMAVLAEYLK